MVRPVSVDTNSPWADDENPADKRQIGAPFRWIACRSAVSWLHPSATSTVNDAPCDLRSMRSVPSICSTSALMSRMPNPPTSIRPEPVGQTYTFVDHRDRGGLRVSERELDRYPPAFAAIGVFCCVGDQFRHEQGKADRPVRGHVSRAGCLEINAAVRHGFREIATDLREVGGQFDAADVGTAVEPVMGARDGADPGRRIAKHLPNCGSSCAEARRLSMLATSCRLFFTLWLISFTRTS